MMLLESPSNDNIQAEVEESYRAVRATLKPQEWKGTNGTHIGGHYRTVVTTGATTLIAAAGALLSVRWTNADRAMLINRIRAWATIGTVFTTAQELSLSLVRVTNFVNADSAGAAVELGESCRKDRSTMVASQITQLRVADAAAVTKGASSAEESPIAGAAFKGLLNVVGSMAECELYNVTPGLDHPIVISRLEGFRILNRVAEGAAGVVVMSFEIDWTEVPTSQLGQ